MPLNQQLILTDLHLHEWPEHAERTPSGHSRLLDGFSILEQASAVMDERKIQDGLFLGDINHLHDKMLYSVMHGLERWMSGQLALGHHWTFLCGNHDRDTTDGRSTVLGPFRRFVRVIEEVTVFTIQGVRFYAIPWLWNAESFTDHWKSILDTDVVLLHHDLADVPYRGRLIGRTGSSTLCKAFTLSGHYHDRIQVSPTMLYCGAPMHHDRSDEGKQRGMHILKHEGGVHSVEFVPTRFPRFVTLTSTLCLKVSDDLLRRRVSGNFVRILYGAGTEEARNRVQGLNPRTLEVIDPQTRPDLLVLPDEQSVFDFESVVKEYVKEAAPASLSKKRLTKLGLQALEEAE